MDGRFNLDKQPEIERRRIRAEDAEANNDAIGQIRNTPEYIARAAHVCRFLGIKVYTSAYEADPQVSYASIANELVPQSADSDILAYGTPGKAIIVKSFLHEWFRVIDPYADISHGDYPLIDLFQYHGIIVFRLYAACLGCDFTHIRSGIRGIGYATFVSLANMIEGELTARSLGEVIWREENGIATNEYNNFESEVDIEMYSQSVVDVYSMGRVYDEESNIIDISGEQVSAATTLTKRHMTGKVNCRTLESFSDDLTRELDKIDVSQLLHQTASNASNIRGA